MFIRRSQLAKDDNFMQKRIVSSELINLIVGYFARKVRLNTSLRFIETRFTHKIIYVKAELIGSFP